MAAKPRQLANGKWQLSVTERCPYTGRQNNKKKNYDSERQAIAGEEKLRAAAREMRAPKRAARERVTVLDLAKSWLTIKGRGWKPSTMETHAKILELHILPVFGSFMADAVTDEQVIDWHEEQLFKKYRVPRVGGDPKKVRWVQATPEAANGRLRVLSSMMGWAKKRKLIPANPCLDIERHPVRSKPKAITAAQIGRLLDAARDVCPEHWPMIAMLAWTGLRFGELSALKWSDLDEHRGAIIIQRSLSAGQLVHGTKNDKVRTLPLIDDLKDALAYQRGTWAAYEWNRAERCHRMVRDFVPSDFIFTGPRSGKPIRNSGRFTTALRAAREAAGIPDNVTFHGVRHTFNNISRQVTSETVTRAMTGHSSQGMTEHYSDVHMGEKHSAVQAIVDEMKAAASGRI